MDTANHPSNSTSRGAKQSVCLDSDLAFTLATSLVQSGLPVQSASIHSGNANEIIVEIAPDGTVTISAINTLVKSAERSRLAREITVAEYIKARTLENPSAVISVRNASKATGIPKTTLTRCEAWIAYLNLVNRDDTGELRTRQLTAEMLACVQNRAATDPADIVEAQEEAELVRLIEEQRRDAKSDRR